MGIFIRLPGLDTFEGNSWCDHFLHSEIKSDLLDQGERETDATEET